MSDYAIIKDAPAGKPYLMRRSHHAMMGERALVQPVDFSSEPLVLSKVRGISAPLQSPDSTVDAGDIDDFYPVLEKAIDVRNKSLLVVAPECSSPTGHVSITPIVICDTYDPNIEFEEAEIQRAPSISSFQRSYLRRIDTEVVSERVNYSTVSHPDTGLSYKKIEVGTGFTGEGPLEYIGVWSLPLPPLHPGSLFTSVSLWIARLVMTTLPLYGVEVFFLKDSANIESHDQFLGVDDVLDMSLWTAPIHFSPYFSSSFEHSKRVDAKLRTPLNTLVGGAGWPIGKEVYMMMRPRIVDTNYGARSMITGMAEDGLDNMAPYIVTTHSPAFHALKPVIIETRSSSIGTVAYESSPGRYALPRIVWDVSGAREVYLHVTDMEADASLVLCAGAKN